MTQPTPGQVAYDTFVRVGYPAMASDADALWHTVQPHLRRAWEAAAQAVLALEPPQEATRPTCRWCGQPHCLGGPDATV